jgi:transcriptional regulator
MTSERELLYKVLFDMRGDINELRRMMTELLHGFPHPGPAKDIAGLLPVTAGAPAADYAESEEVVEESRRELTKADVQRESIIKALRRHNGRRKDAAAELFMSERTLYRKIKELGIDERL